MVEPVGIAAGGVAAGALAQGYLSDKFDKDDAKIIKLLEDIRRELRTINQPRTLVYLFTEYDTDVEQTDTQTLFSPTSPFLIEKVIWFGEGWNNSVVSVGGSGFLIGSSWYPLYLGSEESGHKEVDFPLLVPGGSTVKLYDKSGAASSYALRAYLIGRYIDHYREER